MGREQGGIGLGRTVPGPPSAAAGEEGWGGEEEEGQAGQIGYLTPLQMRGRCQRTRTPLLNLSPT